MGSVKTGLDRSEQYIEKLAENYSASYLVVSTIDVRPEHIGAGDASDLAQASGAYWDTLLTGLAERQKNIHRFELRRLIEDYGRKQFYSAKFWYMGSIPYDMKALHLLAEEGIVLDSAHEGAIYQDTQKQIKKMQQQGVLLAIASKNNSEDVQSAFRENPHMILKESDFSAIYADWNPKPVNIGKIAEELNLGLDSFVFVDDNEAEREAMRIQQPEVTVVDFPTDLTTLPAVMAEVYENYFFTWHLTDEDKAKTAQYQQERERRKERESAVSYEDYLRSLQTTIRLAPVNDNTRERAVQLMNKTNQFNTCTLRMDELALEHYLGEEGGHLLMAEVSDKYGNSGWVSEFLYHQDGDTAVIDNFLMSCRVMGRKVEDAILDAVLKKLQADGITRATAAYKKTAKNKPVEALWEQLGFTQVSGDEEQKQYERKLTSLPETEQIHTVVWDV